MKLQFPALTAGLFALAVASSPKAHGCASCGCSLASDWEVQGYSIEPGLKLDINYNYLDQHQYRHGTGQISPQAIPDGQEMERNTVTHTTNLTMDYIFNSNWAASLQVPWISRAHGTFGEEHDELDTSNTDSIGDIKLMGRYQGFTESHNFGIEMGLKLPTGKFSDKFHSGEALDRGLQPGTGTTDFIGGLYYFDSFSEKWGYFAQANVQVALDSRDGYRPGTAENINFGVRYTGFHGIVPQIQINGRIAARDTGVNSDNFDSGGSFLLISPGITFEPTQRFSTYVFVQVPLYQNVNGYQLSPTWSLTAGVRYAF